MTTSHGPVPASTHVQGESVSDASVKESPLRPRVLSLFDPDSDDDDDDDESVSDSDESADNSDDGHDDNDGAAQHDADTTNDTMINSQNEKVETPNENDGKHESESVLSCISSVGAENGDDDELTLPPMLKRLEEEEQAAIPAAMNEGTNTRRSAPITPVDGSNNPDSCNEDTDTEDQPPNTCASSTQSESTQSVVTDNGQATSRLVCQLSNVLETEATDLDTANPSKEGVYHVTFYTRKIGLQFQKVPPSTKRNDALTAAMTSDLQSSGNDSEKTASELEAIAEMSMIAKGTLRHENKHNGQNATNHSNSQDRKHDSHQVMATPIDVVLVCGFEGFNDDANHVRPRVGARLVAFDGISVETGSWTFDSIRRAIQARGRPLTLTFRDDSLTFEQRAILTKAVADVKGRNRGAPPKQPPKQRPQPLPTPSNRGGEIPDAIPTTTSSMSDSEYGSWGHRPVTSNEGLYSTTTATANYSEYEGDEYDEYDDDLSVSVASSNIPFGRSFSATNSTATYAGGSYRSFSDAGSSSVISSTFGPLVANLMTGLKEKRGDNIRSGGGGSSSITSSTAPGYLSDQGEAVEFAPEHQDFQSNLL